MTVIVNGHPQQVSAGVTLAELLTEMQFPRRGIAVEINEAIVPRMRYAEQTLTEGDRLEVVSLVGGG